MKLLAWIMGLFNENILLMENFKFVKKSKRCFLVKMHKRCFKNLFDYRIRNETVKVKIVSGLLFKNYLMTTSCQ